MAYRRYLRLKQLGRNQRVLAEDCERISGLTAAQIGAHHTPRVFSLRAMSMSAIGIVDVGV